MAGEKDAVQMQLMPNLNLRKQYKQRMLEGAA